MPIFFPSFPSIFSLFYFFLLLLFSPAALVICLPALVPSVTSVADDASRLDVIKIHTHIIGNVAEDLLRSFALSRSSWIARCCFSVRSTV